MAEMGRDRGCPQSHHQLPLPQELLQPHKTEKRSQCGHHGLACKLLEIIYKVWKEKRPYYEKELAYTV